MALRYVEGVLERQVIGAGTKSEHVAIVLKAEECIYKLRRRRGNPFYDELLEGNRELEESYGKTVMVRGDLVGGYILEIDDAMIARLTGKRS